MIQHLGRTLLLFALGILSLNATGQSFTKHSKPAKNWKNESLGQDSVYGTGSDKALGLLKGYKSNTVIVAVIDGGVYINHPALAGEIWTNPKEIANNGIDDDSDGYVDDIHGWDFIGGRDSDVRYGNLEITRLYRSLTQKFSDIPKDKIPKDELAEYNRYQKIKTEFEARRNKTLFEYNYLEMLVDTINNLKTALNKKDFDKIDLDKYKPADSALADAQKTVSLYFQRFKVFMPGVTADSILNLVKSGLDQLTTAVKYQYNVNYNPRFIVGDDYADASQRYYGNNDVVGPTDVHGTHVSGIIAGQRTTDPSKPEGIADNVKIMVLRVVPDGDECDKDVANAIRYAVDHGARVINMSFGKPFAYNKKTVDEAVKYAEDHDVLLVHAAGNDHNDNDTVDDFPNARFEGTRKTAKNWIEVGACDSKGMPAEFSNYGKKNVDLFAPGVDIYSSIPDSGYAYFSGTSMASPCVSGVAALIREYFPKLTAEQVKKILMESVTKVSGTVPTPGHPDKMVNYSDLCVSGGVINAYAAVKLAIKMAGK